MKAVVFHDVGDIRFEDVPEPALEQPEDAIVRLTTTAICGTDLHLVRGTITGVVPGTILGHEGVGIVEEFGPHVTSLQRGERVIIPSTIACGYCSYCRAGYYSQCDNANPHGPLAGTAFFGGAKQSGPFHGLQAEYARVPFASVGLIRVPDEVSDDQAIMLSDVFPAGYFGAQMAKIKPGRTVAVFGCGPVGQFAIMSAFLMGAGRVLAVDGISSRLEMARRQGAEAIDFNRFDPVEAIRDFTGGIGVDCAIDAVGVDAVAPKSGPALKLVDPLRQEFALERKHVAPHATPQHGNWEPGDAPSLALLWEIESLAKAGTLSIVGTYPSTLRQFAIGEAMNKNLNISLGNCPHRRYIPHLLDLVRAGEIDPTIVLTKQEPISDVIEAYERFDRREAGWLKVALSVFKRQLRKAA